MEGLSPQFPAKKELTEDERLEDEMRSLRLQFPNKRFRISRNAEGRKFVEVVLDW